MNGYIQTAIGIAVSVLLFILGYRQTVGAKKERIKAASQSIIKALIKRIVLENYDPKLVDLTRLIEGKAREFQVSPGNLMSEEQYLNQVYTEIFDNDFITPETRVQIEKRIENGFREFARVEAEDAKEGENTKFFKDGNFERMGIFLALIASTLGAVTAVLPKIVQTIGAGEIDIDPKYFASLIGVFISSLAVIIGFLFAKKSKEVPEQISRITAQMASSKYEQIVLVILKRMGLKFEIEPQNSSSYRPDFLVITDKKRIAIEVKSWHVPPPLHSIARMRDMAKALRVLKVADETWIVTPSKIIGEDDFGGNDGIKFIPLKELQEFLKSSLS